MRSLHLFKITLLLMVSLVPLMGRAMPREPRIITSLRFDRDVGRLLGDESDSEGPKSFAVGPEGTIWILDQVNLRVLEFSRDGRSLGSIPLPSPTFDDVALFQGDYLIVMDRLVTETLLVMTLDGEPLMEMDLVGRGIPRGGAITSIMARSDGVWVEVNHRHSVRVLTPPARADGRIPTACKRQVVWGRPVDPLGTVVAALHGREGATLTSQDRMGHTRERVTLTTGGPLRRIVAVESTPEGTLQVVLNEAYFSDAPPHALERERYVLVFLDEQLRELGRLESRHTLTRLNQRVEFRSDEEGNLIQMAFDEEGVTLLEWRLP